MTHPVRIGNAEREQTISALGEHFAAGRLDPDEYTDRVTQAYQARWSTDLLALLHDLPLLPPRGYRPPPSPPRRNPPVFAIVVAVVLGVLTLGAIGNAAGGHDIGGVIIIPAMWVASLLYLLRRVRRP